MEGYLLFRGSMHLFESMLKESFPKNYEYGVCCTRALFPSVFKLPPRSPRSAVLFFMPARKHCQKKLLPCEPVIARDMLHKQAAGAALDELHSESIQTGELTLGRR